MLKWTVIYLTEDFQVRRIAVDANNVLSIGGLLEAWAIDSNRVLVIERLLEDGDGQLRPKA